MSSDQLDALCGLTQRQVVPTVALRYLDVVLLGQGVQMFEVDDWVVGAGDKHDRTANLGKPSDGLYFDQSVLC